MKKIEIDLSQIPQTETEAFLALCKERGLKPEEALVESMLSLVRKSPISIATPENASEWLTTEEAMKELGYKCVQSVLRKRAKGVLRSAEYPRKPYRFRRVDVEALRQGAQQSVL